MFDHINIHFCFSCYFRIVKGLHVNFAPPEKTSLTMILSMLLGHYFPRLFGFTHHDIKKMYPLMQNLVVNQLRETGYMHIQATKPDTAGKKTPTCVKAAHYFLIHYFSADAFKMLHYLMSSCLLLRTDIYIYIYFLM